MRVRVHLRACVRAGACVRDTYMHTHAQHTQESPPQLAMVTASLEGGKQGEAHDPPVIWRVESLSSRSHPLSHGEVDVCVCVCFDVCVGREAVGVGVLGVCSGCSRRGVCMLVC